MTKNELAVELLNFYSSRFKGSENGVQLRKIIKDLEPEDASILIGIGEEEEKKDGNGIDDSKDGLYDSQIDKILKVLPHYAGTFSADELNKIPKVNKVCAIINTDVSSGKGKHWVALNVDSEVGKTCEFYDPFGEDPPKMIDSGIRKLINDIKPLNMLKYKVNGVKNQSVKSSNCGWHCIRFLTDRNKGVPFDIATGFRKQDNSKEKEKQIEQFKKKFKLI